MARYRVGLETRARILEATREVLGETGFENTTLKAITDRAGVGAGSFYNLFGSKEAAVFEVLRESIAAVDPDPGGLGKETLVDLIEAFVAFFTDQSPTLARIHLQLIGTAMADAEVARRLSRSHFLRVERFAAAICRGEPSLSTDDAEERAEMVLGALTGLAIRYHLNDGFDFRGHARRLPRAALLATVS